MNASAQTMQVMYPPIEKRATVDRKRPGWTSRLDKMLEVEALYKQALATNAGRRTVARKSVAHRLDICEVTVYFALRNLRAHRLGKFKTREEREDEKKGKGDLLRMRTRERKRTCDEEAVSRAAWRALRAREREEEKARKKRAIVERDTVVIDWSNAPIEKIYPFKGRMYGSEAAHVSFAGVEFQK